jgi:hypothetical protein
MRRRRDQLTQLNDVSNNSHDQETHAHGLRDAEELAAVSCERLHVSCSRIDLVAGRCSRLKGYMRTLAAAGQELAAILEEFARHLEELLCLIHCERV